MISHDEMRAQMADEIAPRQCADCAENGVDRGASIDDRCEIHAWAWACWLAQQDEDNAALTRAATERLIELAEHLDVPSATLAEIIDHATVNAQIEMRRELRQKGSAT